MIDRKVKAVSDGPTCKDNNDHYAHTDEKPPGYLLSNVIIIFGVSMVVGFFASSLHKHLINSV